MQGIKTSISHDYYDETVAGFLEHGHGLHAALDKLTRSDMTELVPAVHEASRLRHR